MGDNILSVTRSELDDHGRKMRDQAEATVALLERLMNFAETTQKRQQKLETQLAEESNGRKTAEEKLQVSQKECDELHDKSADLSVKLGDLGEKYGAKEDELTRLLPAKEQEIERLKEAVTNAEGLLTGVKFMRRNIDSFRLGQDFLQEPCGVCMLPDGRLVVADTMKGLLLYSGCTELTKTVQSDEWKWPQCLVYDPQEHRIIVCLLRKTADRYRRSLAIFNTKLDFIEYIDGPGDEQGFDAAALVSLTYSFKAGSFYMSIADKGASIVYMLPLGTMKWLEVISKSGATFTDIQILSHHEGTTELLCIERRMASVHKFALNGTNVIFRKTLATVEKPSAMCVDDSGALFIHDGANGKIYEFDTCRFDPRRQIGLVDDNPYSITASNGYLGVATRTAKCVQVFRYKTDASAFASNEDS